MPTDVYERFRGSIDVSHDEHRSAEQVARNEIAWGRDVAAMRHDVHRTSDQRPLLLERRFVDVVGDWDERFVVCHERPLGLHEPETLGQQLDLFGSLHRRSELRLTTASSAVRTQSRTR